MKVLNKNVTLPFFFPFYIQGYYHAVPNKSQIFQRTRLFSNKPIHLGPCGSTFFFLFKDPTSDVYKARNEFTAIWLTGNYQRFWLQRFGPPRKGGLLRSPPKLHIFFYYLILKVIIEHFHYSHCCKLQPVVELFSASMC